MRQKREEELKIVMAKRRENMKMKQQQSKGKKITFKKSYNECKKSNIEERITDKQ
jgi:hypothetical protein